MKQKIMFKAHEFVRKYCDYGYRIDWDVIKFSKADSSQHNLMVASICDWLLRNNIPFLTQMRFKTGYKPDILAPTHIKPIIEVRASETPKKSSEKEIRIPAELQGEIIFVDCLDKDKNPIAFN